MNRAVSVNGKRNENEDASALLYDSVRSEVLRDEPWCTKNTPSQTNMLSLSGIKYIPSGQCPGYLNEAYSWDIVVYVTNGAGFPFPPSPAAVTVTLDRAVPGVGGSLALPG